MCLFSGEARWLAHHQGVSAADAGQERGEECSFFFQAEDGIRDLTVTGVQTCALPIYKSRFNRAVAEYLQNRPNLFCVFALIDSGLSPQPMDIEFLEWLTSNSIPFVIVLDRKSVV